MIALLYCMGVGEMLRQIFLRNRKRYSGKDLRIIQKMI